MRTHPLAWWAWAGGVAVAIVRTADLTVALLLLAVVAVAITCRGNTAWARAFPVAMAFAGMIIVVRTGFYILVGLPDSSPVLVDLPEIALPDWFTNLSLLGPIHSDGLRQAFLAGLTLAALVVTFGAMNAIVNPRLALRHLPGSLHHLGAAGVIAVSAAPQLLTAGARVRRAQQLRGTAQRGVRAFAAAFVPVLAGALDQALELAASMDSRGYARTHSGSSARVNVALTLALVAAVAGTYALLDVAAPLPLGAAMLSLSALFAVVGSVAAARAVRLTRYRPHRWGGPAWVVCGAGLLAAVLVVVVPGAVGTAGAAIVSAVPALLGPQA